MLETKLFKYKKVKIGGVKFLIKKLTPSMFFDKEYMFPMSPYFELIKDNKKELPKDFDVNKKMEEQKQRIKDVILKAVISVNYWFNRKNIIDIIDEIMNTEILYSVLFTAITEYSFGVKKNNYRLFRSVENLQPLFIK